MADTETTAQTQIAPRKFMWRRFIAIGLLLVVVIVAGAFLAHALHIGEKVYAQAAGHKIYKADIDAIELGGGVKNHEITDHQAATVLADKYLTEAMAKQQNISVSKADMVATYGKDFPSQKSYNPYGYQNLLNQLYFTKLDSYSQGAYSGKLLVANFSRYIAYQSALLPEQRAANPLLGNAAAVAQDKAYAQTFITDLYNQVKAKKITFDQAIQAEHNDPQVGLSMYPTQLHSGAFDGPLSQIPLLNPNSIRSKIIGLKKGQLTPPFVVKVADSAQDPASTAESYFLVVQMDNISGNHVANPVPFPQELTQAKKQLGYKVNV